MSVGRASAPGSSANLGPGFDVLAVAWEMRCRVTVTRSGLWRVRQDGEEWTPHDGEFVKRAAQAGGAGPFLIEIENDVPRARGLGSSSAVATAVSAASFRASGAEPTDGELFAIVTGLEGHPDNAAAAVFGGLVMVDGLNHVSLELAPGLQFLAAIPESPLRTAEARAALSDHVTRPAMVRSLARFGHLIEGLRTGRPEVLRRARGDELHEQPRASMSPITGWLVEAAFAAGALHASWSGAGPTALALTTAEYAPAIRFAWEQALDGAGTVRAMEVADEGWR